MTTFIPDQERETWTGEYGPIHVHGIYPWSVLRTTSPEWQARLKYWRALIGDGSAGRTPNLYAHGKSGYHTSINGGRSTFDPVLTELVLSWYAPPNANVVDPFAGGITRGAVAAHLGHSYIGFDLSGEQVEANRRNADRVASQKAIWQVGDAQALDAPDLSADLILTCPPYHNVEKYSDDPADLSAMGWEAHNAAVAKALAECYRVLRHNRYLVWVTGDLRGPNGHLRLLPHRTALAIENAGFKLVNEHVLINAVGTRHRMLRRWWSPTRSAGRLHQHIYVAVKGDRRAAADVVRRAPHC